MKPISILIAEDNRLNHELLHDYFTAWGCAIYPAWDGEQAVELSAAYQPDLIIMDIQMPRLDGLKAIDRIRATPGLNEVPIIALTALVMDGDRERCLAAGADAYLGKPVQLRALRALADQLLTGRCERAIGAGAAMG